jgi:hypothetical protein
MSAASVILIAYGLLSVGAGLGWIARSLVVREQVEPEVTEFTHRWVNRP